MLAQVQNIYFCYVGNLLHLYNHNIDISYLSVRLYIYILCIKKYVYILSTWKYVHNIYTYLYICIYIIYIHINYLGNAFSVHAVSSASGCLMHFFLHRQHFLLELKNICWVDCHWINFFSLIIQLIINQSSN